MIEKRIEEDRVEIDGAAEVIGWAESQVCLYFSNKTQL